MALVLDGCSAKLARAQEHLDSFKRQTAAWMDKRPYTTVRQVNADGSRHSLIVRVKRKPDFQRWSLVAGDAFHNLRSALDHLVYAVAVHEVDPVRLPSLVKKLAFPICDNANDWKSKFWHVEPLSPPVRTEIEALQPYHRPHAKLPPLLAVLRDFDDIDKHRLLQMAIAHMIDGQLANINARIPPGETMHVYAHTAEIVDGTEIIAIMPARPTPDVNYNVKLNIGISLPHAKGPLNNERGGVIYLFDAIKSEVEFVIDRISKVVS